MKITLRFLAVFAVVAATTVHAQTWLLSFDNATGYRGASQNGTDTNGNLWNNLNPWYWQTIQTVSGTTSGGFHGDVLSTVANVDSWGGPAGINESDPLTQAQIDGVVIDSAALGLLGGSQAAAAGYAVTSNATSPNWNFQITTLNTKLTYDAIFYGAHTSVGTSTSVYSAYTDGNYTTQSQSTTLNVGGNSTYNTNTVATLTGLTTDASSQLNFQLSGSGGSYGYLNSMELYGYLGYLGGSTTTLNTASTYVVIGTYPAGGNRSVDTVIGGGSTVNVNIVSGMYGDSTLVMRAGGGAVNAGAAFSVHALTGSGNLTVGGNSTFSISSSGNYSGTLTLNGSLTLEAASGLGTGSLVLNGGTLGVGNATALGTGAITVASGTTTLNNYNSLAALTGNNPINLNGGWATFQVNGYGQILNLGTGNVTVTGNNNLNAWSGGMRFDGVISGSGLLNWYGGGSLTLGAANTFNGTVTASGNNGSLALANVNALQNATLNMGPNQTLGFGVSGNNTYNIGALTGSNSAATIALGGNRLNVGGSNSTTTYAGILSGTGGGLTKSGSGALTLSGNNTYTGATQINGGILQVAAAQALSSSGNITFGGGTLQYTTNGAGTDYSARFKNSASAITLDTNGQTATLAGAIDSTNIVGLTKIGNGTLTLSGAGANTYTGTTTITGGTLILNKADVNAIAGNITLGDGTGGDILQLAASNQIADASIITLGGTSAGARGWLQLNGNNETIGGLSSGGIAGAGLVANESLTAGSTLTLNVTGSQDFSGLIRNASSANGSMLTLVKTGSGTQTLSGANTYTGGTQINEGILQVGSANALGNSTNTGNLTFGGGTLQYTANGTGTDYSARFKNSASAITLDTNGQNATLAGAIDSTNIAGLTKLGSGTLTLSGSNAYTGATTITTGALQIGTGSTTGSLATTGTIAIGTGASLVFNRSDTVTQGGNFTAGTISGNGSITQNGTGKLVLSSGNTFLGGVVIHSGTVGVTEGSSLGGFSVGAPQLTFAGNSTMQFQATPVNFYNSARKFSINAGVTATFDTQSFSAGIDGIISGSTGSFVKIGSGTLTLRGNNTYGGGTTVSAGTLTLGSSLALGSTTGALALNGGAVNAGGLRGAALDLSGSSATVGALTSADQSSWNGFNLGAGANALTASSANVSGTNYIGINNATSLASTGTYNLIHFGGSMTGGGAFTFTGAQDLTVPVSSLIVKSGTNFYRLTLNNTGTAEEVIVSNTNLGNTINIMPLGASISFGTSSTGLSKNDTNITSYNGGGYHTQLYQTLVNDGRFNPNFVGSQTTLGAVNSSGTNILTTAGQTRSEGHSGYTTSQILNNLNADDGSIGNNGGFWLASGNGVNPNYIPLNVGGNDFTALKHVDDLAINRYDAIISQVNTLRAGVDTLATNLMYRDDGAGAVFNLINTYFNPYVQGVVYNHVLAGQNVQFVDLYGLVTPGNSATYISRDGIHPTQAGYNLMGDILYSSTIYGAAYWTGAQGGDWSTLNGTSTNWAMDSARTTDRQVLLTNATANTYSYADVFFNSNASPLATTLGSDTTVRSLNFAAGATGSVSVGGNNTLSIGGGGITVQQGTGAHTVSANTVLTADQTWGNVSSNNLTVSGSMSGSGNLTIVGSSTVYTGDNSTTIAAQTVSGTGSVILSGNNTFTGTTTVASGTLQADAAGALGGTTGITVATGGTLLLSASSATSNSTTLALSGGTVALNPATGVSNALGALTLTANSIIDFGAITTGTNILTLGGVASWSGTLSIWNWSGIPYSAGGTDRLMVSSTAGWDVNLGNINFFTGSGTGLIGTAMFVGSELVAVPEPSTWIAMCALALGGSILVFRRRCTRST